MSGLSSFKRRMQAIPAAVRLAVAPALVSAADDVAQVMRTLAPKDDGDLAASIQVTGPMEATPPYSMAGGSMVVPENKAAITVGNTNVRYPHLQEYGTTFHAAQPYFWPAFRLTRKKAAQKIKRAIGKAVRQAK